MPKYKLFTDNDLDGDGCGITAESMLGPIDITYCTPSNVNAMITKFIDTKQYEKYDIVFITDLVISEDTAKLIDSVNDHRFRLLDHHKSSLIYNDYSWAWVQVKLDGRDTCGTELLFDHINRFIKPTISETKYNALDYFVECVRLWDVWDWPDAGDTGVEAKELNTAFKLFGNKRFHKNLVLRINQGSYNFISPEEYPMIEVEENRKDRYFKKKFKHVKVLHLVTGEDIAYVFAEEYLSELGNYILRNIEHSNVKYVAMINPDTCVVSMRSIKGSDVKLDEVARCFSPNGGGHESSAGFRFDEGITDYMVRTIFGDNTVERQD